VFILALILLFTEPPEATPAPPITRAQPALPDTPVLASEPLRPALPQLTVREIIEMQRRERLQRLNPSSSKGASVRAPTAADLSADHPVDSSVPQSIDMRPTSAATPTWSQSIWTDPAYRRDRLTALLALPPSAGPRR
jgi:hypothetical protein